MWQCWLKADVKTGSCKTETPCESYKEYCALPRRKIKSYFREGRNLTVKCPGYVLRSLACCPYEGSVSLWPIATSKVWLKVVMRLQSVDIYKYCLPRSNWISAATGRKGLSMLVALVSMLLCLLSGRLTPLSTSLTVFHLQLHGLGALARYHVEGIYLSFFSYCICCVCIKQIAWQ